MQQSDSEDLQERIRRRAYELWEQSGRPEGREKEHWDLACWEIHASAENPDVAQSRDTPPDPPAEMDDELTGAATERLHRSQEIPS
jgi:hypothetical protein